MRQDLICVYRSEYQTGCGRSLILKHRCWEPYQRLRDQEHRASLGARAEGTNGPSLRSSTPDGQPDSVSANTFRLCITNSVAMTGLGGLFYEGLAAALLVREFVWLPMMISVGNPHPCQGERSSNPSTRRNY